MWEISPALALTWMREPPASLPVTKDAERSGAWPGRRSCVWGRRALERRGRETLGSLEQRKRPTRRVERRPPRPGPGRPKGVSDALTVERGTRVNANSH